MFSLESSHGGNSYENPQYIIFNINTKITLNYPTLQLWNFSKGQKNEFETAVVNESSVLEQMKFYCNIYAHSPLSFIILDMCNLFIKDHL